ncbi:MAG: asparagine synthase (glutamine-hydrolyzing) [Alphaproteobacteria bacterium]
MCGFIAEIRFDKKSIERDRLEKCAALIHHRGPDDDGVFICDWAGLAFKRLAIIDLSKAGHQPMATPDNRYVIVFNGELYNFKELRAELENIGVEFSSHSDTEVVLRSFEAWGVDAPKRFIGMFAFVVLDTQLQKTYIVRDQLGIKPLYLMRHDNALHLASEIKAFRAIKEFSLNENALYEHFSFGYVAGSKTLFQGIEKLESGTILTLDKDGNSSLEQYYDSARNLHTSKEKVDYEKIRTLIEDSISRHTLSDVGYNLQLSGGIDSSYIVATLVSKEQQRIGSYSVTIDGTLSEESYQKDVIKDYPTDHHSYHYTGQDLAECYVKATWHMDAPNMHLASPLLMMLCDESAKTSKVILTGEGADELFGGYDRFKIGFLQRLGHFLYKLKIPASLIPNIPKIRALKPYLHENTVYMRQRLIPHETAENLLTAGIPRDLNYRSECLNGYNRLEDQLFISHQKCYLQSILERQDKISMAASVEARVPFCTPPLFDYINSLPYKAKLSGGITKATLKTLAENFFDHDFIHRRKSGFTLPIDEWLDDDKNMGRFLGNLEAAPFCDLPYFNHGVIQAMLNDRKSGCKSWHKELMILINFDIWYQLFISETLKP